MSSFLALGSKERRILQRKIKLQILKQKSRHPCFILHCKNKLRLA